MKKYIFQGKIYPAKSRADLCRRLGMKPWDKLAKAIVKIRVR